MCYGPGGRKESDVTEMTNTYLLTYLPVFYTSIFTVFPSANYQTLGLVYLVYKGIFNNKHAMTEFSRVPLKCE